MPLPFTSVSYSHIWKSPARSSPAPLPPSRCDSSFTFHFFPSLQPQVRVRPFGKLGWMSATNKDRSNGSGDNTITLVGGTVGGVLGVTLLVLVGILLWNRNRRTHPRSQLANNPISLPLSPSLSPLRRYLRRSQRIRAISAVLQSLMLLKLDGTRNNRLCPKVLVPLLLVKPAPLHIPSIRGSTGPPLSTKKTMGDMRPNLALEVR